MPSVFSGSSSGSRIKVVTAVVLFVVLLAAFFALRKFQIYGGGITSTTTTIQTSRNFEADYGEIKEVFNSNDVSKCSELVQAGKQFNNPLLVDSCYYNIAHSERNESKCSLIKDTTMREYCVKRVLELRQAK